MYDLMILPPMSVIAIWIAFFSIIIPLFIPFSKIWRSPEIRRLQLTQDDRRQRYYFLVWGIPLGIVLGFGMDIPVIFDMFGLHREWFFVLIQFLAALLFIPLYIILTGIRGMSFLIKTTPIEKRKGISEGMLTAVIAWQVMLFFSGNYEILIPGFNEALQDMKSYFMSFSG